MANEQKYVVVKDGQRITDALPKQEADQKAAETRSLCESQGQPSNVTVVPYLLG